MTLPFEGIKRAHEKTAIIAQTGPKIKESETDCNIAEPDDAFGNSIPLGKNLLVNVALTTLLTAIGAMALNENALV